MGTGTETTTPFATRERANRGAVEDALGLVVAWSAHEPERVGEVAIFLDGDDTAELGRGELPDGGPRVVFHRQRPGSMEPQPPLGGPGISRRQLLLRARGTALVLENIGRSPVRVNGTRVDKTVAVPGDTVLVEDQLLLLVVQRPSSLAAVEHYPQAAIPEFGRPDGFGILGESPAAWQLRNRLGFIARAPGHVLVTGPSGTGKELAANAVHALSTRASGAFVARNAATFPDGLIDAELFGNVRNYPNPGMPERRGLIGEADGGTLFLDEIAELPLALQSHLLRVLDAAGEYQRLGETTSRRADVRVVAATNRDAGSFRHDLLARLTQRVEVPPLADRREDIPLIARHVIGRAAAAGGDLVRRFATDATGTPRLEAALVDHLLRRPWTTHVRELEVLLWEALSSSPENEVALTDAVLEMCPPTEGTQVPEPALRPAELRRAAELSAADIRGAIKQNQGNLAEAARALGLSSRYQLYRLLKKHGIDLDAVRS
jgi:DNA-binding NtrC family response regulator